MARSVNKVVFMFQRNQKSVIFANRKMNGRVAQLDRASDYGSEG